MTIALNETISCELCKAQIHRVSKHLEENHAGITVQMYKDQFPNAPVLSPAAIKRLQQHQAQKEALEGSEAKQPTPVVAAKPTKRVDQSLVTEHIDTPFEMATKAMHELFNLKGKDAFNSVGQPIPVNCVKSSYHPEFVPEKNSTYIFEADMLKNVLIGLHLNINVYVWGHKGTGKSELFEQIAAHTNQPFIRIQHTANTEESHIVGQMMANEKGTYFELGPLANAMKYGWIFLADEYDFAMPSVLSVYQAVLEGKPLMIKEANKIIKPHPNFRFVATGNTNGTGDETGMYQGTNMQNSANYDRFGICLRKEYMKAADEIEMIMRRCQYEKEDATKLVNFANKVREAYDGKQISDTISPRSLINGAMVAVLRGSLRVGVTLAFINKLSRRDAEIVDGIAQRTLG